MTGTATTLISTKLMPERARDALGNSFFGFTNVFFYNLDNLYGTTTMTTGNHQRQDDTCTETTMMPISTKPMPGRTGLETCRVSSYKLLSFFIFLAFKLLTVFFAIRCLYGNPRRRRWWTPIHSKPMPGWTGLETRRVSSSVRCGVVAENECSMHGRTTIYISQAARPWMKSSGTQSVNILL